MDQRVLFQPADLRLRNADLAGDLHLGAALIKPQLQNVPFPFIQAAHGVLHADLVQPVLEKLLDVLPSLENEEVLMTLLWIFSVFTPVDMVLRVIEGIVVRCGECL